MAQPVVPIDNEEPSIGGCLCPTDSGQHLVGKPIEPITLQFFAEIGNELSKVLVPSNLNGYIRSCF